MPSGRTADMKTAKICAEGRSHRWEMTVELHQAYTSPEPGRKEDPILTAGDWMGCAV